MCVCVDLQQWCVCACACLFVCVCMCVCVCTCVYVYVYVHTHVRKYISTCVHNCLYDSGVHPAVLFCAGIRQSPKGPNWRMTLVKCLDQAHSCMCSTSSTMRALLLFMYRCVCICARVCRSLTLGQLL